MFFAELNVVVDEQFDGPLNAVKAVRSVFCGHLKLFSHVPLNFKSRPSAA